jgi:hypothetical protein
MLARAMRRRRLAIVGLLAALATGALLGCGEEEELEVVEGEPLELGDLGYNVQLTRFLNPDDVEDSEYLVGQPEAEPGTSYLGVFLIIENHNEDETLPSADEYVVVDTVGNEYEAVESESPYALEIGATVPAGGALPIPDSTAASGPTQGALLLFVVDDTVTEDRPLELEIPSGSETGRVELDI